MKAKFYPCLAGLLVLFLGFMPVLALAQTDQDALLMGERKLCAAASLSYSSWTDYWEGTFKRNNENLGRVSTESAMLMVNYGLKQNLNILAALPYVRTRAGQGTFQGISGLQDLSLFVKWRPWRWEGSRQVFSLFAVGGFSTPTNDYNIEFMPMCIGLGSQVWSGRLMADLQRNKFTATFSGAYLHRNNVKIDRLAYYTDHLIYSNEVRMPDAGHLQFRAGYRSARLVAEAFVDNMTTFGGFDIRKNDMPFVSNRMNSTKLGIEAKYYLAQLPALGFHAAAGHTVAGRNVGQASSVLAGVSYIFDFNARTANN